MMYGGAGHAGTCGHVRPELVYSASWGARAGF